MARHWVIEGYDGTKRIFHTKFKASLISDRQIKALLQTLTARTGLALDEIVGCYMLKHTKLYSSFLEVRQEHIKSGNVLTCGENPHFVARIVRE
jgi:hypothetical protein